MFVGYQNYGHSNCPKSSSCQGFENQQLIKHLERFIINIFSYLAAFKARL